jgi:hypothetical protein
MHAQPAVLRDYALLADGERGALVGPDGTMAWLCFPRWDSPAVFDSLIGGAGEYVVRPTGRWVYGGYYEDGLIWRNRWTTDQGRVECRDALALPGSASQARVIRMVTAHSAPAEVLVRLALRSDFGRDGVRDLHRDDEGSWRGKLGNGSFCWTGAPEAKVVRSGPHDDLVHTLVLPENGSRELVLTLSAAADLAPGNDPREAWRQTEQAWHQRLGPHRTSRLAARDVRHGRAVLHGLSSASGGMVAAATLGLPERARAGRNYDYRYAWVRDQCFAGHAGASADDPVLLDGSLSFVTARLIDDGPSLSPAYRVDGSPVPDERRLALAGYPGGQATVGNWVNSQFQLDSFGNALSLLATAERVQGLTPDQWRAVSLAAQAVSERQHDPDSGIWEIEPRLWTQSRLQCVAGLRAVAGLHRATPVEARRWAAQADRLLAEAVRVGLHPSGRWQRSPDDPRVDAALLLPAVRGALPVHDPRTQATLAAVLDTLVEDGHCYRFQHGNRPLAQTEGAFLLCGFLMSLSLLDQGQLPEAVGWFERTRAAVGPPGLLSEEYDVHQRQLRGNLPQAFVHALLIEAAARLDKALSQPASPPERRSA